MQIYCAAYLCYCVISMAVTYEGWVLPCVHVHRSVLTRPRAPFSVNTLFSSGPRSSEGRIPSRAQFHSFLCRRFDDVSANDQTSWVQLDRKTNIFIQLIWQVFCISDQFTRVWGSQFNDVCLYVFLCSRIQRLWEWGRRIDIEAVHGVKTFVALCPCERSSSLAGPRQRVVN